MTKKLEQLGRYIILLGRVFSKPTKWNIFFRQLLDEMNKLGLDSVGIVAIISFFIGTVVVIQMAINLENPFIPRHLIGYATRETLILEFSSTIVALILAGKVGSNIASEIGTMRITEQIDALEVMGINSANYLILPKVIAALLFFPFLTLFSMFIGIVGGYSIIYTLGSLTPDDYLSGLTYDFKPYSIFYGVTKSVVFGFLITTIASFYGYTSKGGSLEVGRSSTMAVVNSTIAVLIFNLILTKIFFSY